MHTRTPFPPPFSAAQEELQDGEDIARCPSCSLLLCVIYDPSDIPEMPEEETEEAAQEKVGVAVDPQTPDPWPAPSVPTLVTM